MAKPVWLWGTILNAFVITLIAAGCGAGSRETGGTGAAGGGILAHSVASTDGAVSFSSISFSAALPDSTTLLAGGSSTGPQACISCHSISGWHTGYSSPAAISSSTCSACHNPLGEDQPIGCEACHGGGQDHYGAGPLPVNKPNAVRCGRCHNDLYSDHHSPYHPEGDRIVEDYLASPHARSINSHVYATGSTTTVKATCSRCHTDEGARAYITAVNGTESYDQLKTNMSGKQDIADAAVVQCRTCHDSHNPGSLFGKKAVYTAGSAAATTWSDAFRTCTACHQLLKEDGTKNTAAYHDPAVNKYGDKAEIITDTHYDDPTTNLIEGYIVNSASTHTWSTGNLNSGTCLDCHNQHKADNTINRQWAQSAHAGHINKSDGTWQTVTKDTGAAWVYYDFKASNRTACQRCHTSTGFRNMANNPTSYNAGSNVFIATGMQREMLYCWACHTDNKGHLRNPGTFVSPGSAYVLPSGRSIPTDIGASMLCVNCHSGRQTGQYIKEYSGAITGRTFSSFNPHYLLAGGILYRTAGYEYAGRDYSPGYFKHDAVGAASSNFIGGLNGPCVGCHMRDSKNHIFLPVTKKADGSIDDIPANADVCSKCHYGSDALTPDILNTEAEGYDAAITTLQTVLNNQGMYWKAAHPYFYTTSSWTTAYTSWSNKDTLGAAYNLNLLKHEPGGYAHNRMYVKKLLYDSLDYLDDGLLNTSVLGWLTSGAPYDYLKNAR